MHGRDCTVRTPVNDLMPALARAAVALLLLLAPASSGEPAEQQGCRSFSASSVSEAVAQYETEGFAVVRGVLDRNLLATVARHVDFLTARFPSVPPEHLHHVFMKNDPFWIRLASDERLLDLADTFAPFLDGHIALFSSHYFCKPPRTGKSVLWHQDGSYWPLRPMDVLTLYLAVDAADDDNGGMRVVPGSHGWKLAELRASARNGSDVLGSATHEDFDGALDRRSVSLRLGPGDVEVHHPNLVHRSGPNLSERRRCALTLRYISPTTECWDPEQPVMMMRGEPVPGVNTYRAWPPYRPGNDMPFDGAEAWNAIRRRGTPACDAYFARTDFDAMDAELVAEVEKFIAALGGTGR